MTNKRKKYLISRSLMLLLFCAGILIICYPFYISALNQFLDQRMMDKYQHALNQDNTALADKIRQSNQRIAAVGLAPGADAFSASDTSDAADYQTHLLGSVKIPKINVDIPLFAETKSNLLKRGACLLPGTSYPSGEGESHAVISAHSGLPERKLFTDLEQLVKTDIFILTILGATYAYEVRNIQVVRPEDTEALALIPGADAVTLLTCTPYAINSHRLLVTGHRVPYDEAIKAQAKESAANIRRQQLLIVGAAVIFLAAIVILLKRLRRKIRRR